MQTLTPAAPVTRQRLYQLRKKAEGKCVICGNDRSPTSATYCEHHREIVRLRQNKARGGDQFPERLWSKALDFFLQ